MAIVLRRSQTVLSLAQLQEDGRKEVTVADGCLAGRPLPAYGFAPHQSAIKLKYRRQSSNSFMSVIVPDVDHQLKPRQVLRDSSGTLVFLTCSVMHLVHCK